MNYQSNYQQITQALRTLKNFVNDCNHFIKNEISVSNHRFHNLEDRYLLESDHQIDDLILLFQRSKEVGVIPNYPDFFWEDCWKKVIEILFSLEIEIELLSLNSPDILLNQNDLKYLGCLFGKTYNEIKEVVECNPSLSVDFDEKIKEIKKEKSM